MCRQVTIGGVVEVLSLSAAAAVVPTYRHTN